MYFSVTLPVILYYCETLFNLRVDKTLKYVRRMFGHREDALIGELRKLHKEVLNYFSPSILVN
jgi:hypothetical protein